MAPCPVENTPLLSLPAFMQLAESSLTSNYAAGESVFTAGEYCVDLPVIESGSTRVYASNHSGRQVTLYRLKAGTICPISLSVLLNKDVYPVSAIAETDVQIRYLSGEALKAIITGTPEIFSAFLDTFARCLYDAVCMTHQLMFEPLDVRLARLLHKKFNESPEHTVNFTHEDIARELGTTRVVVSRLLKKLEHANCIRMYRKKIILHNARALKALVTNTFHTDSPV